jgi:hypothetical protein
MGCAQISAFLAKLEYPLSHLQEMYTAAWLLYPGNLDRSMALPYK